MLSKHTLSLYVQSCGFQESVLCLLVLTFGNICQNKGLTYISVGHRPSLRAYHARVLELAPGGAWALAPASPAPSPAR